MFCRDGAEVLYECSSCPRVVCERCISVPNESQEIVARSDVLFICPGCHEIQNKRAAKGTIKPYFVSIFAFLLVFDSSNLLS